MKSLQDKIKEVERNAVEKYRNRMLAEGVSIIFHEQGEIPITNIIFF